jgi:hypothetical protein
MPPRTSRLSVVALCFLAAASSRVPAPTAAQGASGGLISNFGCGGFVEFQNRLDSVEQACCGNSDCPAGVPTACSVNCALVFSPFYAACGLLIGRMLDDDDAGTAQIAAFDQLDLQCHSAVDLSSALDIIATLRDDDSDFLVPALDGFETYRDTDPQQMASQGGQFAVRMASCVSGWTDDPSYSSSCCDSQGQCGLRCPPQPGQVDCIVSVLGDLSDCPGGTGRDDPVTECTQGRAERCTPRQCAAACTNAHGCVSFRYNKQEEVDSSGQRLQDGCGSQRSSSGGVSYCSFSHTCTVDTPAAILVGGRASGRHGYESPYGAQQTWHFYMRRADDKDAGDHH